jgi:hypothetical protein
VAESIDGFAKGSVNFTIGKLIDELKAFERFVRLVGGRRNVHLWILALGLILSTAAGAFKLLSPDGKTSRLPFTWRARLGHCGLAESESRRLDSTRILLLRAERFQKG